MKNINQNTDKVLEGEKVFKALVKKGEANLKAFQGNTDENISEETRFLTEAALSMPSFEMSSEEFVVLKAWIIENGTPYVDEVEQGYLDKNFNIVTKNEIMKNNKANLVGNGEGLKQYLGNTLNMDEYKKLAEVFENESKNARKLYAGKVGFILQNKLNKDLGIARFKDLSANEGFNLEQDIPSGSMIDPIYSIAGRRILERLEKILENN